MIVIAHIRTEFPEKFGVPRQSGLVPSLRGRIIFEKPYRNPQALRGLKAFSHVWLLWEFSQARQTAWSPTVRPPRLGGNKRMGVFATRSPFRPNPIGLSCVKLEDVIEQGPDGPEIRVSGADLMDGTPIYDIKPYLPYADCHPEATGGFTDQVERHVLLVHCQEELLSRVPLEHRQALLDTLAQDPRPSYQHDEERLYGMDFAGVCVRFTVQGQELTVRQVEPLREGDKKYAADETDHRQQ